MSFLQQRLALHPNDKAEGNTIHNYTILKKEKMVLLTRICVQDTTEEGCLHSLALPPPLALSLPLARSPARSILPSQFFQKGISLSRYWTPVSAYNISLTSSTTATTDNNQRTDGADGAELETASCTVNHGNAVEEHPGCQSAEDEVLHRGL